MARSEGHREKLLQHAESLMLAKGFPATRVDEICAAAGVTKGSFYHHFESKDELAKALIEHYFAKLEDAFRIDEVTVGGPVEQLLAFLDRAVHVAASGYWKRGCLLGSFVLNLAETHPDIREDLDHRFQALSKVVEPLIREALRETRTSAKVSAPALARQFVSVLQGAIVLAKAANNHNRVAEGMRCYRDTLCALIGV